MSAFRWTNRKEKAALALAGGYTQEKAAEGARVSERTIRRWLSCVDFMMEVDRLSLMTDIASRAERLRIAMRVVREKTKGTAPKTNRDLLEWLKFAQSETDGAKIDLAAIFAAMEETTGDSGEARGEEALAEPIEGDDLGAPAGATD